LASSPIPRLCTFNGRTERTWEAIRTSKDPTTCCSKAPSSLLFGNDSRPSRMAKLPPIAAEIALFRFGHGVHCSWKFIAYGACDRVAREWSLPTDNCNRSCAAWTAAAALTRADWLSAQTRPERLEFSSAVRTKSPSPEMIRKMTSSARRC